MPFLAYAAVLIATVFSVVLEWDALVEPSAATRHAMQAATELRAPPPAPSTAERAVPAPAPANPAPAPVVEQAPPAAPDQPAAAAPPQCNVDACAAAYVSFRASDCTWQPYEGPRRICEK